PPARSAQGLPESGRTRSQGACPCPRPDRPAPRPRPPQGGARPVNEDVRTRPGGLRQLLRSVPPQQVDGPLQGSDSRAAEGRRLPPPNQEPPAGPADPRRLGGPLRDVGGVRQGGASAQPRRRDPRPSRPADG